MSVEMMLLLKQEEKLIQEEKFLEEELAIMKNQINCLEVEYMQLSNYCNQNNQPVVQEPEEKDTVQQLDDVTTINSIPVQLTGTTNLTSFLPSPSEDENDESEEDK